MKSPSPELHGGAADKPHSDLLIAGQLCHHQHLLEEFDTVVHRHFHLALQSAANLLAHSRCTGSSEVAASATARMGSSWSEWSELSSSRARRDTPRTRTAGPRNSAPTAPPRVSSSCSRTGRVTRKSLGSITAPVRSTSTLETPPRTRAPGILLRSHSASAWAGAGRRISRPIASSLKSDRMASKARGALGRPRRRSRGFMRIARSLLTLEGVSRIPSRRPSSSRRTPGSSEVLSESQPN
ncbi:hypothetical protein Poly30_56990 [Planctomycetes bacterium Poly30]|uniref:Uncharacterized protein n=1 Tax=Saltatorellus ferox TaxID=2528018 RepID=A0A518F1B7_9BACT|nr:hypothetical protein Poly30_56990 [Planctomycetes bacterium Poly30]